MRRGGRAHGCGSSRHAPAAVELLLDHDAAGNGSIERGVLGDVLLVCRRTTAAYGASRSLRSVAAKIA
jgi:hypothetical protein